MPRFKAKEKHDYDGSELKISKDGYINLVMMYAELEVVLRSTASENQGMEDVYGYESEWTHVIEVLEKQV